MGNILKLNDIKTKGCADYPWQNTYLIMELWDELKELQTKVNLLELAAMKDEDIDFSDIPATTAEAWKTAKRGVFCLASNLTDDQLRRHSQEVGVDFNFLSSQVDQNNRSLGGQFTPDGKVRKDGTT